MSIKFSKPAEAIEWQIGVWLKEADVEKFEPILHVNHDALVIEYNEKGTGYKRFEKICELEKNNS